METTIKDFESALAELEAIVKNLEDGGQTLDKSLELFERGVELSRYCHKRLEAAERRIDVLTERGEVEPAPEVGAESAAESAAKGTLADDDIPF